MGSIQSVSGPSMAAAAALAAQKAQAAKPETAQQEALETPAVTKVEAAKGDQQAIRKLAQSAHAPKKVETTEPPKVQGKGSINLTA